MALENWLDFDTLLVLCTSYTLYYIVLHCYESQPVGLAEVISASEASLGGPGGRASQMYKNRVK